MVKKNRELSGSKKSGKDNRLTLGAGALALVFLSGAASGFLFAKYGPGKYGQTASPFIEMRPGGFDFINPLLECEYAQDSVEGKDLQVLREKVRAFVDEKGGNKDISHVSLYFRDLNNGPWIGVYEKAYFSPASLLKVPFMMAILKEAEVNPQLLKQKLTYLDPVDSNAKEHFKPQKSIVRGKTYTVDELIRFAIAYSDNNAYFLLLRNFPQEKLVKVYTELGVGVPYDSKGEDFMTVKEYASFFRILFNASFLNREMSTKALKHLSAVDYKKGIVAGIPASVRAAHKFGERTLGPNLETKQLHDCGIIYYPDHPYLLCVMTRGTSFDPLAGVTKDVSQLIYRELDRIYKGNS